VAGLFVYRRRDHGAPATGFRAPGYPFTPALFVLAAAYVVVSAVAANPRNAALGTLLIALGVPVYAYWARRAPLRRTSDG
jgi:APA family basic amino acid/polyamine antiporter